MGNTKGLHLSTVNILLNWRYLVHITDGVSPRARGALAGPGARRGVTGRACRRSASVARGSRRAPCTQARPVSSRAPLLVAGLRAAERSPQLLHQPAVKLVRVPGGAGRASRALLAFVGAQGGPAGRRAAVGQRAHGRRAAVRAERGAARRQRGPLGARLGHLAHPPADRLVRRLRGPPRPLRVVNVPVVLHHGHHERHLGGGDGGS